MPPVAVLLSILSLIPFVACGLAAVGPHAEPADRMLAALIGYTALRLTFRGGMSWAMTLRLGGDPGSTHESIGLRRWAQVGVVPLVIGWAALIVAYEFPAWIALPILIVGHIAAVVGDHRVGLLAELSRPYAMLRWSIAIIATAMLTTVLILRLSGSTIVF